METTAKQKLLAEFAGIIVKGAYFPYNHKKYLNNVNYLLLLLREIVHIGIAWQKYLY